MNVFKRFKIFICFFFVCFFCFSIVDYSRPKEVKAFGVESIPLVAGGTVLGPGAVVVLGVVAACGIALCNEDVRDFVTDCGTYCYDELSKIKATYDDSLNGINAELTPSLVQKVLEFAKSKEGTSILSEGKCDVIDGYYRVPFSVVQNDSKAWLQSSHIVLNDNYDSKLLRLYVYGSDGSLVTSIFDSYQKSFYIVTRHCYSSMSEFAFLYSDGSISGNIPSIPKTSSILYLYVPDNIVDNVSVLGGTFVYPNITKDGCKSVDEYNDKYKEYTGTNSVCADLTALGGLSLDSSVDDVCTALEATLPTYSDDVIGTSDIPGISIENDGVNTKVDDIPDTSTKDETGVLGSILEWIRSLLLSLFKFLEGLLQKLIELLRDLLVSLFVPSDAFVQEKVDTLKNQLEPKLPYAQYIKLFDSSYEGNELKDIIINIYGQDVVIVKVTLFEHFRNLFNTGVYAVMFFLLAVYNYNNIYKLIRGTDYVSATNTINNATGGTGGSGKGGGD